MPEGASIDEWRKQAGMEWRIQRSKVRYAVSRDASVALRMSDQHVLFPQRTAEASWSGVREVQVGPAQRGDRVLRDIAKAGGLELSAAGTIFGGRRFWAHSQDRGGQSNSVKDKIERVSADQHQR